MQWHTWQIIHSFRFIKVSFWPLHVMNISISTTFIFAILLTSQCFSGSFVLSFNFSRARTRYRVLPFIPMAEWGNSAEACSLPGDVFRSLLLGFRTFLLKFVPQIPLEKLTTPDVAKQKAIHQHLQAWDQKREYVMNPRHASSMNGTPKRITRKMH